MAETLAYNDGSFVQIVASRSGTSPSACFQCHKCTSGCPIGPEMELLPSQVMRLVHLGAADDVLRSNAIWLCASCEACTTRCPMGIDIAAVMDALRILAVEQHVPLPDSHARKFNQSFLSSVRHHGRVFELGMMAAYKLRTGDFLSDVGKVPQMLAKRKLAFWPKRSGGAAEARETFRRAEAEEDRS